jgi:hypothetical protein
LIARVQASSERTEELNEPGEVRRAGGLHAVRQRWRRRSERAGAAELALTPAAWTDDHLRRRNTAAGRSIDAAPGWVELDAADRSGTDTRPMRASATPGASGRRRPGTSRRR